MPRFGVKDVNDVIFYSLLTNKAELFLDTLKMSNLENNAETSYATGGSNNPRLIAWDYGRTATFNIQDALLNPKAISMQLGTELEKKIERIYEREVVVSVLDGANTKVSLASIPVDGTIQLYVTDDGYEQKEEILATVMTVTGKDIEIPTASLAVGQSVIAYYEFETIEEAEVITIKSDKFSGFYRVVGKTLWRNEANGQDETVQIVISKAKIMSNFTLTMQADGDPSVFDFNLDVFKDSKSSDMVKIVRYKQ